MVEKKARQEKAKERKEKRNHRKMVTMGIVPDDKEQKMQNEPRPSSSPIPNDLQVKAVVIYFL